MHTNKTLSTKALRKQAAGSFLAGAPRQAYSWLKGVPHAAWELTKEHAPAALVSTGIGVGADMAIRKSMGQEASAEQAARVEQMHGEALQMYENMYKMQQGMMKKKMGTMPPGYQPVQPAPESPLTHTGIHYAVSNAMDKDAGYNAGVEKFCADAGFDVDDTAAMKKMLKEAGTWGNIIGSGVGALAGSLLGPFGTVAGGTLGGMAGNWLTGGDAKPEAAAPGTVGAAPAPEAPVSAYQKQLNRVNEQDAAKEQAGQDKELTAGTPSWSQSFKNMFKSDADQINDRRMAMQRTHNNAAPGAAGGTGGSIKHFSDVDQPGAANNGALGGKTNNTFASAPGDPFGGGGEIDNAERDKNYETGYKNFGKAMDQRDAGVYQSARESLRGGNDVFTTQRRLAGSNQGLSELIKNDPRLRSEFADKYKTFDAPGRTFTGRGGGKTPAPAAPAAPPSPPMDSSPGVFGPPGGSGTPGSGTGVGTAKPAYKPPSVGSLDTGLNSAAAEGGMNGVQKAPKAPGFS